MYTYSRLLPCAAVLLLVLSGCATRYDRRIVERRTQELYDARLEPSSPNGSPEAQLVPSELLERADLQLYLTFGLKNSAELRAAFESWRASAERVAQVSSLPDPRLSFGHFVEEVQTRTGAQQRSFGLSQGLPWPGELDAKAKLATERAEVAWTQVEHMRLRVARQIEEAFYEYAYLARELDITRELLELVRGFEPVVQGRIRGGNGQEDLLRLQVEIGRLEDDLASVERHRPAASARLADAMNFPLESAASLPLPEIEVPKASEPRVDALLKTALAQSPRLHVLENELAVARASEELTEFKRRPDFAARVDYIDTGNALNPATAGSGNDPLFLGLSMTLPIWTSNYSAAEREARHQVRAARANLDGARSRLNFELAQEAYRVDDSQRRIRLYQSSLIPRAREALQLTTVSYRAGSASVLDLLDSERALLEFELSLWRASREYLQGWARLKEIVGGEVQ